MRRGVMVRDDVVDRELRLERERVQVAPPGRPPVLEDALAIRRRPRGSARVPGRTLSGLERNGLEQSTAAEADVAKPVAVLGADGEDHVRPCAVPPVAEPHARRERRHAEAEVREHGGEERVLLEAVAAAPCPDEFGFERREVEPDRAAEEDVEVLERDRGRVRAVESGEAGDRRRRRRFEPDPAEIGGDVRDCAHDRQRVTPQDGGRRAARRHIFPRCDSAFSAWHSSSPSRRLPRRISCPIPRSRAAWADGRPWEPTPRRSSG